jgi:hypothetical protein
MMSSPALRAQDSDDKPSAPKHVELSLSGDTSSIDDRSLSLRMTVSPFGDLDADGLRLQLDRTGSHYSYERFRFHLLIEGNEVDEAAMLGYALSRGPLTLAAFVGADRIDNSLSVRDPSNQTVGIRSGPKGALELSYDVSPRLSVETSVERAVPNEATIAEAKVLYALSDLTKLGPSFTYQCDIFYRQYRAGAVLSGLKFGLVEMEVGAGYVNDSRNGPGAYVSLDNQIRF